VTDQFKNNKKSLAEMWSLNLSKCYLLLPLKKAKLNEINKPRRKMPNSYSVKNKACLF